MTQSLTGGVHVGQRETLADIASHTRVIYLKLAVRTCFFCLGEKPRAQKVATVALELLETGRGIVNDFDSSGTDLQNLLVPLKILTK